MKETGMNVNKMLYYKQQHTTVYDNNVNIILQNNIPPTITINLKYNTIIVKVMQ